MPGFSFERFNLRPEFRPLKPEIIKGFPFALWDRAVFDHALSPLFYLQDSCYSCNRNQNLVYVYVYGAPAVPPDRRRVLYVRPSNPRLLLRAAC